MKSVISLQVSIILQNAYNKFIEYDVSVYSLSQIGCPWHSAVSLGDNVHVLPLDHYYTYMTTLSIRVLALADKYSPCKRIYIVYTPELSQTYITLVGASSSMQYFLKLMSP